MNDEIFTLYSQTAEQAVLGAMLLDQKIAEKVVLQLTEADYWINKHRQIFTTIQMLVLAKKAVDTVAVYDYLEKKNKLTDKDLMYLTELTSNTFTTAQTDSHVNTIKAYSIRRALLQQAEEIKKIAYDVDKPIQEVYCDAVSAVEKAKPTNERKADKSLKSILFDTYFKIGEMSEGKGLGIPTGIATFDRFTGGLFDGEFTIIGARPAVGKSAFAMQIAMGVAKQGRKVMFFSLEMSEMQYGIRVFSHGTGISSTKMRTGKICGDDFGDMNNVIQEFGELPIIIDTEAGTPMHIRNAVLNEGNVGLVVVDYLQLVRANGKYGSREQEVSSISRAFKLMSRELDRPVIALAQLHRPPPGKNPTPTMSDLRESGSQEQDGDNIILLHEPTEWDDKDDQQLMLQLKERDERLVMVIHEKQRMGSRCFYNLNFRPEHMDFISLMKE